MRVLIGLLAILLVGCTQMFLVKDGMTAQQFHSDQFDCEQKVVTMYGGYANAVRGRQEIVRCMTAKGYREATNGEYKQAIPQTEGADAA